MRAFFLTLLLLLPFKSFSLAQRWVAIKFRESNIGYTLIRQEGKKIVEITSMKVRALGQKRTVNIILEWEIDDPRELSFKKIAFEMASEGAVSRVEGYVWKNKFLIKVNGFPREFFPVSKPRTGLSYILLLEKLISEGNVPEKLEFDYFDPSVLNFGKMQIRLISKRGDELVFLKSFAGLTSKIIFKNRRWVREEGQANIVFEPTTEEQAKKIDDIDLILATAVRAEGKLPSTRTLRVIKFEVSSPYPFPEFPDQTVEARDGVFVIERVADELSPDTKYKVAKDELERNLKREPLIDFSDPKILSTARKIAKGLSPFDIISRVSGWVFSNLKKTSSLSMPSASEVIRSMEGDCNEHAILTVALLRAVGIPARVVFGLVYQNGYFFYHAWVEAWDGRMWYEVDPTFGQVPADILRIKIGVGNVERWNEVLKYVGKIKIKILEWW